MKPPAFLLALAALSPGHLLAAPGLLLAAPGLLLATPAWAASPWMAGLWFGSGQPNDKSEMWLARAGADGRFHVLFRACRGGKAFDQTNDGIWRLDGNIETIRIDAVGGDKIVPRSDVYTILSHSNVKQIYRYEGTGFVYTSHKVAANFVLPPCDLSS